VRKASLALILFCAGARAAGPWDTRDLWNWRTASEAQISPDGQWVVYAEGWNDRDANATRSNLWAVSIDGKKRVRVTDGAWRDRSPRWSPDGTRIAWIQESGNAAEIRATRLEVHDELRVAAGEIGSFAWAPDGRWIAFTIRLPGRRGPPAWAPLSIVPWLQRDKQDRMQWFVAPASGGTARQMADSDVDAIGEPAWMPGGQAIISAASDGEIYAIRVADGGVRRLTAEGRRAGNPVVSPDGARIAYLSTDARPRSYAIRELRVMNADGSRGRVLAGSLDRDATDPQWSSDSRTVYFTADDRGATHVYAARNDGSVRQATRGAERLRGFSLAANGRAASVRSTAAKATEVVTFAVDVASTAAVLAAPNAALLAERETGAVEEFAFPSEGKSIQGWMLKPPGFDASRKYPLLLDIQDAPRRMYGEEFSLRGQIYAAQGYVVLHINPRGTPGYGEEFGLLLPTRFPGDDADDLLRGVDFATAKDYVDARRMAVSGGLLAAWIIGHTNRFAAAVARHPIADWTVDVATAPDGARRAAAWMSALPWDDPDQYTKHSPIYFAQNFQTPTLVLAGDRDPEAEELYFALQSRKVEAALIRLPEGRPGSRVLGMEAALAWVGKKMN